MIRNFEGAVEDSRIAETNEARGVECHEGRKGGQREGEKSKKRR